MDIVIMVAQLILALAILVSLHEWGHYITARSFGIRVEKFYIFFDAWGKKIFSKKINGTEWGIGWLPLGGYVKISGMIDESLDKDQMGTAPEAHEFRSKPAWQRLIVMIGGVTVNLILGFLIFAMMLFYYGDEYIPNSAVVNGSGISLTEIGKKTELHNGDKVVRVNGDTVVKFKDLTSPDYLMAEHLSYTVLRNGSELEIAIPDSIGKQIKESKGMPLFSYRYEPIVLKVQKKSNASKGGLKKDDRVVGVDTLDVQYFDELTDILQTKKSQSISLAVLREGKRMNLPMDVTAEGTLGFELNSELAYGDKTVKVAYGFFESFPAGVNKGMNILLTQIKGFGQLITGKINPAKSVMGPIQMTKLFGADWDWKNFWRITGVLSLILAFMNLLPIPALDGGHVVFLLLEMITGKPLSEKVMYVFQIIGMIILFGLMAFVFGVDIFSIFTGN
ncbi:MAG: regulator of sigma E protease [Bacteroidia bacterium]|jgi:regulator of sigma E protease